MKGLLLFLSLVGLAWAQEEEVIRRVVILANSRQAESVELARFYAAQRGVPAANIVALPLPEAESITWRQFIDQVYQPVQDELYRRGWIEGTVSSLLDALGRKRCALSGHHVSYLVVCRGVPLRIFNDPTLLPEHSAQKINALFNKNEAAVDSELSLLALSGYDTAALVANPLFARDGPVGLDGAQIIKVSRLDGPTWASARHLVTAALQAERNGLLGRYYVDLKGPHADGDQWLESVRGQLQELGFDGDTETTGTNLAEDARFDAPVLYFGWYAGNINGPFLRDDFTFPPGAIALHIHSYSAQTLQSPSIGWCGPFVARGVTATVGNVFEPYLQLTHRPNLLLRALSQGRTFGDAVYYSLPALSWQAVAIGDPLYRPFKVTLEQQLASGASLPRALAPYALIREATLLVHRGQKPEAIALLRTGLRSHPDLALGLALARLLVADHEPAAARQAVGFVREAAEFRPEDWPLVREIAALLGAQGGGADALQIYGSLLKGRAPSPGLRKGVLADAQKAAETQGDEPLAAEFARQLAGLDALADRP